MAEMRGGGDDELDAVRAYYMRTDEATRLSRPIGRFEFERIQEIVLRALPEPPARVADIGGGAGAYAVWLARGGYSVVLRDLFDHHVETARAVGAGLDIDAGIGDARSLDLESASVDAVLLLGPLYHLVRRTDRDRALAEARRIVRPGGHVFVAGISRWAGALDGGMVQRLYERVSGFDEALRVLFDTGFAPPLADGDFTGYFHRPDELRAEVTDAGLVVDDICGVESAAFALADLEERAADQNAWRALHDLARSLEHVPELMGLSPHLLVTARRP